MKFTVFSVVVLALIINAQSSVIPIGGLGPVLAVSGPAVVPVVHGGSVAIQAAVHQPALGSVAIQAPVVPSVLSVAHPAVALAHHGHVVVAG